MDSLVQLLIGIYVIIFLGIGVSWSIGLWLILKFGGCQ